MWMQVETYGHVVDPIVESKRDINNAVFSADGEGLQEIIRAPVKHRYVCHQTTERDQNCDIVPPGNDKKLTRRWSKMMPSNVSDDNRGSFCLG